MSTDESERVREKERTNERTNDGIIGHWVVEREN